MAQKSLGLKNTGCRSSQILEFMSKEIINIGCVSKGRLKIQSEQLLKRKKLKIFLTEVIEN